MPRENFQTSGPSTYCFFCNIKISPKEQYAIIVKNNLTPDEVAFRIQGHDRLKWGPSEMKEIREISDNGYLSPITVSEEDFNILKAKLKNLNEVGNEVGDDDNSEEIRSIESAEIFAKVVFFLKERQLQEQAQREKNLIEVIDSKSKCKICFRLDGKAGLNFSKKQAEKIALNGYSSPLIVNEEDFNFLKTRIDLLREKKVQEKNKKQARKELVEKIVSYGKSSKMGKHKKAEKIYSFS